MDKFSVGEIAVIDCLGSEYHGQEVEIVSALLAPYEYQNHPTMTNGLPSYGVERQDGGRGFVPAKYLRKKRPPTVDWHDMMADLMSQKPTVRQDVVRL